MSYRLAKENSRIIVKAASANGRFCEMAAVPPQAILCEIARLSPAASSVKPPPRKAAGTLGTMWGQCVVN